LRDNFKNDYSKNVNNFTIKNVMFSGRIMPEIIKEEYYEVIQIYLFKINN